MMGSAKCAAGAGISQWDRLKPAFSLRPVLGLESDLEIGIGLELGI